MSNSPLACMRCSTHVCSFSRVACARCGAQMQLGGLHLLLLAASSEMADCSKVAPARREREWGAKAQRVQQSMRRVEASANATCSDGGGWGRGRGEEDRSPVEWWDGCKWQERVSAALAFPSRLQGSHQRSAIAHCIVAHSSLKRPQSHVQQNGHGGCRSRPHLAVSSHFSSAAAFGRHAAGEGEGSTRCASLRRLISSSQLRRKRERRRKKCVEL